VSFTAEQLQRVRPLWDHMLSHRFLQETRDGTIAHETFAIWMRQDYLFVEAAIPFISAMLPKAPREHWGPLTEVVAMLQKELVLFRERAEAVGVDLDDVRPSFVNHAFMQFLMATAYQASYAEVFTLLYAGEKCYHDSWSVVKQGIDLDSPWYPFVENWAGEEFAQYLAYLEAELDQLAEQAGPAERARMAELFELMVRYEIAFWEMAATSEDWPTLSETARAVA
jgi:thiaminase/transcriptional activator TenA